MDSHQPTPQITSQATIEQLFARYIDDGDVDALADVFDRTAPELLRVAVHLAGRTGDADDLLQSTFLTALEKRARWERTRPLVPWLVGILETHGRDLQRKRARRAEELADGAHVDEAPSPEASASFRETTEVFTRALSEVPEIYRNALLAFFRDERKAVEIADELGVAPGTVRMRVHRGLELLKRALPAGAAVGVVLSSGTARGLSAVRAEVLRRGVELAPAVTAGGALATAWTSSIVLKAAGFGVAVLLAILFWRRTFADPGEMQGMTAARGEVVAKVDEVRGGAAGSVSATAASSTTDDPARRPAAVSTAPSAARDESWTAALVGFSGRIVDESGKPIGDLDVRLMEFDARRFELAPSSAFEPTTDLELELDRARTDRDGRFHVRGARCGNVQALFVDAGGPRGTLHVVDRAPAPGTDGDLGSIVLADGRTLRGRITRDDGAAVSGARVIAVPMTADNPLAKEVAPVLAQNVFDGVAFAFVRPGSTTADMNPAPRALRELLASLPFPMARSSTSGEFVLEHAPSGPVTLLVVAEGVNTLVTPIAPERNELGALVVHSSTAVRGRVVDARGAAVVGARVLAAGGSALAGQRETLAVFHGGATTDAEGRFTVIGLAGRDALALAVQPEGALGWELHRDFQSSGDVEVRVRGGATWTVVVRDAAGQPLPGARVEFAREATMVQTAFGGTLATLARDCDELGRASASTPIGIRCRARVSAPGFEAAVVEETPRGPALETEVTLDAQHTLAVHVRDARDGTPVRDALVRLIGSRKETLSAARTDASGAATLAWRGDARAQEARVVAEHPRFASTSRGDVSSQERELTLELGTGGGIEARVRLFDQPAQATLVLTNHDDGSVALVRSDEKGNASVANASPGHWSCHVRSSLARLDQIVDDSLAGIEPTEFDVQPGRTTTIVVQTIAARPTAPSGDATLRARVRIDGRPAANLHVSAFARAGRGWSGIADGQMRTDAEGRFTIGSCPRGEVHLELYEAPSEDAVASPRFHASHALTFDEDTHDELAIDLRSRRVELRVLDEQGKPLAGASAGLAPAGAVEVAFPHDGVSDAEGRVVLLVGEERLYRARAQHDEHGSAARDVDVRFDGPAEVIELKLSAGVPCKGVARLDGFKASGKIDLRNFMTREELAALPEGADTFRTVVHLTIYRKDDRWSHRFVELQLQDGSAPFEVRGLTPGDYTAIASSGANFSKPFDFTLGPSGDSALDIRLRTMD